jgi:hypothetical protein
VTTHVVSASCAYGRASVGAGNLADLYRRKPFLREEVERDELGSPPAAALVQHVQSAYWFSAHMHVKYPCVVTHADSARVTRFLALDKCLPNRDFLQVLELPVVGPVVEGSWQVEYDPEWLSILKRTHAALSLARAPLPFQPELFRPSTAYAGLCGSSKGDDKARVVWVGSGVVCILYPMCL